MKRILIFSPFSYWKIHTAYDVLISKALSLRGADVLHIACNKDIDFCDIHDRSLPDGEICNSCTDLQQSLFTILKTDFKFLGEYIDPKWKFEARNWLENLNEDELEHAEIDGRKIGKWVASSIFTNFRVNRIYLDDPAIVRRYREYLETAYILYHAVNNILNAFKPESLFIFNGRMFMTRIPLELARERNIEVVVHDRGYKQNTIQYRENETILGIETPRAIWKAWKNTPLDENQLNEAKQYILDREAGKNIGWFSWVKEKSTYKNLIPKLRIDPAKPTVTIFTSSDDEMAAFKDWSNIFDSQKEWLTKSIEYFTARKDLNLIIKVHPNTIANPGRVMSDIRFMDFINNLAEKTSDNIKFIMPADEINSYQIMDISSHVIVFFSSVSIESSARFTPVLLCGGGPFKDLELSRTLKSKENYFTELDEFLMSKPDNEQIKYAYRFAYYYFVKQSREIKAIIHSDPFTPKFNFNKFQDIMPGKDAELDAICNKLMNHSELIDLRPKEPSIFDEHAENEFINDIIEERIKIKNEIKEIFNSLIIKKENDLIFSVIIPTYNRTEILKKCLEALSNQSFDKNKFEVIVVDDGSEINPENVISYYKSILNLTLLRQENRGPAAARNNAIKISKGKYLLILNDDSIAAPNLLEVHYKYQNDFAESKVAVIGSFNFIEEENNKIFVNLISHSSNVFLYPGMKSGMFYSYKYFWTCNISVSREDVITAGMFDEKFPDPMAEDIELGIRLERMGYVVCYAPDAITLHHHTMDVDAFIRRQMMWGKNLIRILKKYPPQDNAELLLLGINRCDGTVYNSLKQMIEKLQPVAAEIYQFFKKYGNAILSDNLKLQLEGKNISFDQALPRLVEMMQPLNNYFIYKGVIENWNLEYGSDIAKFSFNDENLFTINAISTAIAEETFQTLGSVEPTNIAENILQDKVISVIIPTYNRKETLLRCLDALNNQTYSFRKFEVIVIDDGGNDGTSEIQNTKNYNFDFAYLWQENSGPATARNKGIEAARGEYILIINDDTIAAANLIEKHLEIHKHLQNTKAAVLGTFDYVPESKIKPFVYFLSVSPMVFAYPIMKTDNFYNYRFFWTCNISIKKQALIDAGMFDEDFNEPMVEDTELGYRLEKMGYKVYYSDKARAMHDHTLTPEGFARRQKMSGRNVVKLFKKHPELLIKEQQLFGFANLNDETQTAFRQFISQNAPIAIENLENLKELNKIDIFNPGFIPITPTQIIKSDELVKIIESKIWIIHLVNFYQGILDALSGNVIVTHHDNNVVKSNQGNPKILFTMFGWNESGGGTQFPHDTAVALAKLGYKIGVFYAGLRHPEVVTPYFIEKSNENGVELYGVFNRASDFLMVDKPELEIHDKKIVEHFEKILDEFKPDVVHFQNFLGLSFQIAESVAKRNIPSLFTPHNYHIIDPALYMINSNLEIWRNSDFFQNSELLKKYPEKAHQYENRKVAALKLMNNWVTHTIAISKRQREIFIDFGVNPDKISVVHQIPQIETGNIPIQKSGKNVMFGFIGSVIPHKGVHKIIEASNLITQDNYEIRIYGEGNKLYINELQKIDRKGKVSFLGRYHRADLPNILAKVDVIIVPSIWEEAAGLVLLESLALGTPVIASKIGGIPEFLIENYNGILYPYYSSRNLSASMSEILKNYSLLEKLKSGSKLEKKYQDYLNILLATYNNLFINSKHDFANFIIS